MATRQQSRLRDRVSIQGAGYQALRSAQPERLRLGASRTTAHHGHDWRRRLGQAVPLHGARSARLSTHQHHAVLKGGSLELRIPEPQVARVERELRIRACG